MNNLLFQTTLNDNGASAPTYTAEYNAILNLATAQGFALPSDPTKTAHNAFIVALKAAGLWNEFDLLNIYYGDMAQDFARINWVNPVAGALATFVNTPTYTNKRGFNSAGAGSYIDTEFAPSTVTNYRLDDCSLGYFGYNDTASNRIFGCTGATLSANYGGASFVQVNGGTASGIPLSSNDGLIGGVRTDASTVELFRNATSVGSDISNDSTALSSNHIHVLSNGAGIAPTGWQVQAAFAGSSTLYADGGTAIATAFNNLMATSL